MTSKSPLAKHADHALRPCAWAQLCSVLLTLWWSSSAIAQTSLAARPEVSAFLDEMAREYQLDRGFLDEQFKGMAADPGVIKLMQPTPPGAKSWQTYRSNHLDAVRIQQGQRFLVNHRTSLKAAERQFGVPAEIITAILGIETNYGATMGSYQVLRTLSTLTFSVPEWSAEFRPQLVSLLLLARDQKQAPNLYLGSFAGAMGYPQFMPSTWREYGVDGNGDGKVDLIGNVDDAIFSIGNYLQKHGWSPGEVVAIPVKIPLDKALALRAAKNSDQPNLHQEQLLQAGVQPTEGSLINKLAILVDLPTPEKPTEFWIGYSNFFSLMQYNRSFFYAMSVYQLARSLGTQW